MPTQYPSGILNNISTHWIDVIIVNLESETSILIMKDPDIPMLPRSKEL